jgi:hypothetical protein
MYMSKLAVFCLCFSAIALFTWGPASAVVLFPGYHDFHDGGGIFEMNEANSSVATAIRTYWGGYGHTVLPTSTGVIMGGTYGAGGFECCDPWLVWFDTHGNPVKKLIYDADELAGANNIQSTSDGGFIMGIEGITMMAVKVDAGGDVEWAKSYGEGGDNLTRVYVTADGDYILVGGTPLDDDGVKNNGRVIRLDPYGNVVWDKVIGEYAMNEYFTGATIAHNGNNILVGMNAGDYWVLEIDQSGDVIWEKTYGGPYEEQGRMITRIRDRFYMVVGGSDSFAGGGMQNFWALVITETGQVVWEHSLGGSDSEVPYTVIETSDGGVMLAGGSGSFGAGAGDIWLVKFDSRGQVEWQKTYGTWRNEHAWHVWELPSGGYVVVGDSYMYPDTYNVWLMAIDENGDIQYGDCGEVGDTFAIPFQTSAAVSSPTTRIIDKNMRVTDIPVNVIEQTYPIDSCTPGN